MRTTSSKSTPKIIKLDAKEKYTRLFSAKNGNAIALRSGWVTLKENENVGEHNTGDLEEILIILEGEGELCINKSEKLNFKKNTALYVSPNTVHDVRNTGQKPLKYVFITCPAK